MQARKRDDRWLHIFKRKALINAHHTYAHTQISLLEYPYEIGLAANNYNTGSKHITHIHTQMRTPFLHFSFVFI